MFTRVLYQCSQGFSIKVREGSLSLLDVFLDLVPRNPRGLGSLKFRDCIKNALFSRLQIFFKIGGRK